LQSAEKLLLKKTGYIYVPDTWYRRQYWHSNSLCSNMS